MRAELTYLWYYLTVILRQILPYYLLGTVIGSVISVFAKDKIHGLMPKSKGFTGIIFASILGILSPLCMYGTVPIAASFSQKGVKDDILAAFMMSSVLLNPQLAGYSFALGKTVLAVRVISCFLCGLTAGLLVRYLCREGIFNFEGFKERSCHDTHPNLFVRLIKNIGRNLKATGMWFAVGILLSVLFQRYVPQEGFADLFGNHRTLGVFLGATVGIPLYACGGGTIPLLRAWLDEGMTVGAAAGFMLTGPATKITNLGALKIVLGIRNFVLYILYVTVFAVLTGLICDYVLRLGY